MVRIYKKLNQRGFDHVLLPVVVAVLVGIVGVASFVWSHAATPTYYNFKLALAPNYCLDNDGASSSTGPKVYMYPCNTVSSPDPGEEWETVGTSSRFMLEDPQDTCVSSINGVGSPGNRHDLYTEKCDSNDENQMWHLNGDSELVSNDITTACINDPGSATTTSVLILYPCSNPGGKNPSPNYEWEETQAPTKTTTPTPVITGGPTAPVNNTDISASDCPNAVRSGVVFSTLTPYGDYGQCIEGVQNMVNGLHAFATVSNIDFEGSAYPAWPGGNSAMLSPDGDYGSLTAAAVTNAEKYINAFAPDSSTFSAISTNGEAGPQTLKYLCFMSTTPITNFIATVPSATQKQYSSYPSYEVAANYWALLMFGKGSNGEPNCPAPLEDGPQL